MISLIALPIVSKISDNNFFVVFLVIIFILVFLPSINVIAENIFYSIYPFRWGTHLNMSFFLSVCLSICPLQTILQEPYIMWSLFLLLMCKMMISWHFFLSFFNFDFLGCWVVEEEWWVKAQKIAQK